jgi:hypothetical protein
VEKEIWCVTDRSAREVLVEKAVELTEEELQAVLDDLPLYLDAALEECVLALARQELEKRRRGNSGRPSEPPG